MRIEMGHPDYEAMFARWKLEGTPRILTFNGAEWLCLEDNGKMFFVRTGSSSGVDNRYSESSIPLT